MKRMLHLALTICLPFLSTHAQWDTTTVGNEVSTTDEIVGPVLRISNEIRIPNTFSATDPTIGTLDNTHYGINLHKTNGIGFAFNGIHQMVFKPNGDTGIGTSSPIGKLHVSTGTSGDAIFRLEADTDNNNESDNPMIQLRQDGGQLGVNIGFSEENFGGNVFGIGTRYINVDTWDNLTISTQTGKIGIGTAPQSSRLGVEDSTNDQLALINSSNNQWQFRTGSTGSLIFKDDGVERMRMDASGNLGVGTINPGPYKLAVKGKIRAEEIKVETGWADYVFKEDYDLPTLVEVEKHIQEKGHLINIPSAKDVEENGVQLGEMNKLLLEKIEELTLYTLHQQKELQLQKEQNKQLANKLDRLEKIIYNISNTKNHNHD